MWFRQLFICTFEQPVKYSANELEALLQTQLFSPCTALTPVRTGFVPPIGDDDAPLVFSAEQRLLMCMKVQHKVLPKAVLREQHLLEVQKIEDQTGRTLPYPEKKRIKDELEYTLLGKAFSQSTRLYAYIDIKHNRLVVGSSNKKRLELFLKLLSPLISPNSLAHYSFHAPSDILTQWLSDAQSPAAFSILDRCTLETNEEKIGTVRLSKVDLFNKAMDHYLEAGNRVTQLSLNWNDSLLFQLKKDFTISSIQYLDNVKDLAKDGIRETEADRFATDFFIMSETLDHFFKDLLAIFIDPNASQPALEKQDEEVIA